MASSIRASKKSRGRPKTTGKGEQIVVRMHSPQLGAIDAWIGRQDDEPSRPEAIRRLVRQALEAHNMANRRKRK